MKGTRLHNKKPRWLKVKIPSGQNYFRIKKKISERSIHTICQSANCPNIAECWNDGNATFLIMGDICTRNCRFCSVVFGKPMPLDEEEGQKILEIISLMDLEYVVITSVTRDDLPDKGSGHFARTIKTIKQNNPVIKIEALIPDFDAQPKWLDHVIDEKPDVISHNIETVINLYPHVNRDRHRYWTSLNVLEYCKKRKMTVKSGMMVGLGETLEEIKGLFSDLKNAGANLLTIGQYLQPSIDNIPVKKYYEPTAFTDLKQLALSYGFLSVVSGPLVRSSYHSHQTYRKVMNEISCV